VAIDLIVQSIKDVLAADQQLSPTKPNAHGDGPLPPPLVKRGSDSKTSRLHWRCLSEHRLGEMVHMLD